MLEGHQSPNPVSGPFRTSRRPKINTALKDKECLPPAGQVWPLETRDSSRLAEGSGLPHLGKMQTGKGADAGGAREKSDLRTAQCDPPCVPEPTPPPHPPHLCGGPSFQKPEKPSITDRHKRQQGEKEDNKIVDGMAQPQQTWGEGGLGTRSETFRDR